MCLKNNLYKYYLKLMNSQKNQLSVIYPQIPSF